MDALSWPSSTAFVVTTTAVATATLFVAAKAALWPRRQKTLRGPLKTIIPRYAKAELAELAYQPDQFPGAKDVETPYGSIRTYEFGPEDGRKVLFVHGISTSCVTLGPLAHSLVERGCRVMLFDLFGRGFSDGVGDLPHDDRLYTTQILLALASSSLPWTGNDAFHLVGYSLGGGIAVSFTNAFPHLVSSLVLLAPAGLIRPQSFGTVARVVFSSGLIPEPLLAVLTSRRLQQPIARSRKQKQANAAIAAPTEPLVRTMSAEAADPPPGQVATPLERGVLMYVRWMVIHHAGFVPAFMSCIRFAPMTYQHDNWRLLAKRKVGSTAVLLANDDEIIDPKAYRTDGLPLLGGEDHVTWKILPGGHDFVMTHTSSIIAELEKLPGFLK